ncbi:DEP domain-containing protein 7-like isoform X2 [Acanthaster planci]|uniref:DEP domain-containing protein 7-like isoform X2 n=1 Tax=Acanthaster planci TaxID=133434 RepID=A0A8B8A3M7_ACAPL|nr:DEP domain-containing protein 7-like isoform X2 [Acanthaster planci]
MATLLKINPLREAHNLLPKSELGDESGAMNGPFRATQRWNSIIKHLQDNVSIKPHKTKTKRLEGCFAGAEAVDVLLPYLQQSGFERDISRENAIKLCQLLLEQSIIEDVLATSQPPLNTKPAFQDNSTHFYRFVKDTNKSHRSSQRLSDTARYRAEKRSAEDDGQSCPHFDRKKKLRHSFGAGKSRNENRCDENDGTSSFAILFDRKKKKRSSFGFGKLKAEALSRVDEGNHLDTPAEKKKRKRNSFGLGRLKTENSYNISGSCESIPQSGDKRRASFRLGKHKLESKSGSVGSQESLSQPEHKKSRRSLGSFRLGKRAEPRNKDIETASITSEMSQQSETKSMSSGKSNQSGDTDLESVQSLTSLDSLKAEFDVNEIWKESTIQRLLELVDIPMLEDILFCTENFTVPSYSSGSVTKRGNSNRQQTTRDQWLSSALACLHSHPDSSTITDSFLSANNSQSQSAVHARKLLLFQTLTNHIGERRRPLMPTEFQDILMAVLGSIARGKTSRAIELAQLAFTMLGAGEREELQNLLHFMASASSKTAVRLSYEIDNRVTVITSFTPAIIPSRIVSPIQAKNLVAFMMDCVDRVCEMPPLVAQRAERRISRLKAGQRDVSQESSCVRVTPQQYHQQRTAGTDAALRDLTNAVIDDVKIPLRDKKQHLQDLKKHHPAVYDKNFADML